MPFFICAVPVCPVRAEATHRSEQVTQLLFGETCELLEQAKDFVRIKVLYDNYEGWCQATQLHEISTMLDNAIERMAAGWVNEVSVDGEKMHVPFGCSFARAGVSENVWGKRKVEYGGAVIIPSENTFTVNRLQEYAYKFLNTPYLWRGRSVFGVDCSGYTQLVFKCMNIKLLRDAYQQATMGDAIGFLQEVKAGDLAFFDNAEGRITHVGILMDHENIIHASGKVRVDTIDNFGIVNRDTGKRTHNLRVIKRIAP